MLDPHVIEHCAMSALRHELALYPKPGLVSPIDAGAHTDMDVTTFERSLSALAGYFSAIAEAGAADATFSEMQALGVQTEVAMLEATGGINTHRGAIFSLGLLAAATGAVSAMGSAPSDTALRDVVCARWRAPLLALPAPTGSHGATAIERFGVRGARMEAADGFPAVFDIALPAWTRAAHDNPHDDDAPPCEALLALVAAIDDTNLLHRGGAEGLRYAQAAAREFLAHGGIRQPDWRKRLQQMHSEFVRRRLSPGGAADMLAAAWFVRLLQDKTP